MFQMNPYSDLPESMQMSQQDIVNMWTQSLRDNPERQGVGRLEDLEGKRCCLGELCYIGWLFGLVSKETNDNCVIYDGASSFPPDIICEWVGLNQNNGQYRVANVDYNQTLSSDNDERIKSWPEIADIIDSHPAGLFNW